jgi:hypothetical protein
MGDAKEGDMTYEQLTSFSTFEIAQLLDCEVVLSVNGFDVRDSDGDVMFSAARMLEIRSALIDVASDMIEVAE